MLELNRTIFNWFFSFSHRSPVLDGFGILLASYLPYLLGLGVVFFIVTHFRDWRMRWFVAAEISLALIVGVGIIAGAFHFFYIHPRPFAALGIEALTISPQGNSFPSSHAVALFAVATILFIYHRKWGGWYFLAAIVVSIARVYAGVHWPFDILGGVATGIFSALVVREILMRAPSSSRPVPPYGSS